MRIVCWAAERGRKLYERRAHGAAAAPLGRMDATYTRLASDGSRKLGGLRAFPSAPHRLTTAPNRLVSVVLRNIERRDPKSR